MIEAHARHARRALILLASALLIGCGGKDPEPPERVDLVSFNAGLAVGYVAGAESRTPRVAEALAELDADVICLQEVWLPEQVDAVRDATSSAFPHHFFPDPLPPEPSDEVACAPDELDNLLECLDTNCGDACTDDVADCLLASCAIPFVLLSPSCQGCAMAHVGEDPATARATCEQEPTAYAYGHSFGTGVLSRYPITSVEHTVFPSSVNRRGAIHAVIDTPNGELDLFCTHLTPDFATLPYPHEEGSWVEEQRDQIETLRDWIDSRAGDQVALLGDFNNGPALDGISPVIQSNYNLISNGFTNPYADHVGECTMCGENPLRGGGNDILIDHVLIRGVVAVDASRVLDFTISAESCDEPIEVPPSDHYGVSVSVEW